jgi:shikimate kinase
MQMKVFLIGYMGVGKTSLGKRLATRLDLPFIDLDQAIEERSGMSIAQIFGEKGEEEFRRLEHLELSGFALREQGFVLATGGGAGARQENIDLMKGSGIVVWLEMGVKMLATRIAQSPDERPLVKGLTGEQLEDFIRNHLAARTPFYAQAHLSFDTQNPNAARLDALAEEIKLAYTR